jgi:hypothetical protein
MFATRRALLWTFAGGCLSGALFILSVVGGVSLWRDFETNRPERTLERGAPSVVATSSNVIERRAPDDDAVAPAVEPPRAPAVPHASDEHASNEVASQKDAQDTDGTNDSGASVADVLVRLEKAYRQGLAPTTPAIVSSNIAPQPTSTASNGAPASTVANAPPAPTTTAAAEPPPAREPSVSVSVIVQNPPAPAPPPEPVAAEPAEAPPAVVAQDDAAAPSSPAAAAPTNINIENLHQGDVYNYNVQQQIVQQYMQVLGASPYGYPYGAYPSVPVAAPAGSRPYAYYGQGRFSNLPALPVSAPPFPSYISSVTNPDNPNGVHSRALRFH